MTPKSTQQLQRKASRLLASVRGDVEAVKDLKERLHAEEGREHMDKARSLLLEAAEELSKGWEHIRP